MHKHNDKLLEFESSDGLILIEIEDNIKTGGVVEVSASGRAKAAKKFEEALSTVKNVAGSVINKIKEIEASPDEVSVKLGIKFNVEVGVVIAKCSKEGNLEITMTWKKDKPA